MNSIQQLVYTTFHRREDLDLVRSVLLEVEARQKFQKSLWLGCETGEQGKKISFCEMFYWHLTCGHHVKKELRQFSFLIFCCQVFC